MSKALKKLKTQRDHLLALKLACDGLKTMAATLMAASLANVKGLAKLYIPNIPTIDYEVTQETRRDLDRCMTLIDSILKKVESASLVTADWEKAIDKAMVLLNTSDQRRFNEAAEAAPLRRCPPRPFAPRPDLQPRRGRKSKSLSHWMYNGRQPGSQAGDLGFWKRLCSLSEKSRRRPFPAKARAASSNGFRGTYSIISLTSRAN